MKGRDQCGIQNLHRLTGLISSTPGICVILGAGAAEADTCAQTGLVVLCGGAGLVPTGSNLLHHSSCYDWWADHGAGQTICVE